MKFTQIITFLASAALASANNIVTFLSQDAVDRTVFFTPNAGLASIQAAAVPAGSSISVSFPHGWIGNWYAVKAGEPNTGRGMLGEVAFNAWGDITFFDVSAIVVPEDHDNVKLMYPKNSQSPTSGCGHFPCDNAYYLPDDVQTKATTETHLICTLGSSSQEKRDVADDSLLPNFKRDFVQGRYA